MGERKYADLVIRGVTYPTAQAAAKALGISDVTVMRAARLGVLDDCGLGRSHPKPMPCRVGGLDFPTVKAAAKHFNVYTTAIYMAINAGDPDRIGRPRTPCSSRARPCTIGPYSWPSETAAARDLGLYRDFFRNMRRRNSPHARQKLLGALMLHANKCVGSSKLRDRR